MKIKYSEHAVIGTENDGTPITLKEYQEALLHMLGDVIAKLEEEQLSYFVDGGTLLGAIRHQDIIPWDDDIDICFMLEDYPKLLKILKELDTSLYFPQCFDTDDQYDVTQPMIKLRKKNTYVDYDAVYARNNCKEKGIFIDFIAISPIPEGRMTNFVWRKMALLRTLFLLGFNKVGINVKWLKRYHIKKAYRFAEKETNTSLMGYALMNNAWQNNIWKKSQLIPFENKAYNIYSVPVPNGYKDYLTLQYGDYMKYPNLDEVDLLHSKNLKLKSGYMKGEINGN